MWAAIGTQAAFPNTCLCTSYIDNGAGLSWSGTLAAGANATYSHFTVFSPLGIVGPSLTKTAQLATTTAGGPDGYTITITNSDPAAVTLTSITDHLPAGFSYSAGTTSGVTTTDPTVNGQDVTWTGTFTVPAASTATLTFGVTVSTVPGTYTNNADGTSASAIVTGTGDTAPVTVTPIIITPTFAG